MLFFRSIVALVFGFTWAPPPVASSQPNAPDKAARVAAALASVPHVQDEVAKLRGVSFKVAVPAAHQTQDEFRKYVVKEIELGAENRSFQERVRLFSPAELRELLEEEGLRVDAVFGDYEGGPLDDRATRTILVATRA